MCMYCIVVYGICMFPIMLRGFHPKRLDLRMRFVSQARALIVSLQIAVGEYVLC